MNKAMLLVLLVGVVLPSPSGPIQLLGKVTARSRTVAFQTPATPTSQSIISEEEESSNPAARAARRVKSMRYGGGGCDLTRPDRDCFFEHLAPGAGPWIPLKQSAIVFLGRVTRVQPYLSADHTHIYTETTLMVEELLKSPKGFRLPPDRVLVVDQIGGTMRMRSGRLVRDDSGVDFLGKAYVEGRCVFFVRRVHGGKDLAIVKAYELRDSKVFKLNEDGGPGNVALSNAHGPESLSDERTLLRAIRQGVAAEAR